MATTLSFCLYWLLDKVDAVWVFGVRLYEKAREQKRGVRVVVCGPPHSGKSVFLSWLVTQLPRTEYFLFRAAPDGEGTWTYQTESNSTLRRKGKFDRAFVKYVLEGLRRVSQYVKLTLVDVGGFRSWQNRRFFRRCDYFVVLSAKDNEMAAWKKFGESFGLECLALLKSDLHGQHALKTFADALPIEGTIANLDRWTLDHKVSDSVRTAPALEALSAELRRLIESVELPASSPDILHTAQLAERLGKVVEPGKRLIFIGEDIRRLQPEVFTPLSLREPAGLYHTLDGACPAFLSVGFVCGTGSHAALNDPRIGVVPIEWHTPENSGAGRGLSFEVRETEGYIYVECKIQGGTFDVNDLHGVRAPVVTWGKGVVISGRGPHWLTATIALAYRWKLAPWIACWQPGTGATIAWTAEGYPHRQVGEMIPDDEIRALAVAQ